MDLQIKNNVYEEVIKIKNSANSNYDLNDVTSKNINVKINTSYNSKNECKNTDETILHKNVDDTTVNKNSAKKKDINYPSEINNNSKEIRTNNDIDNYYEQSNINKEQNVKTNVEDVHRTTNKPYVKIETIYNNVEDNNNNNNNKHRCSSNSKQKRDEKKLFPIEGNLTTDTKEYLKSSGCNDNESNKEEIIFEKKKKKSEKLKKERQKEIIVAYWLKGIVNILNAGFKNGDIKGSNLIGKKIAEVLKKVVEISNWNSVHDLIEIIKFLGKEIIKDNKMFFIIPNIIRRVLAIIRTEHFKQLYLYNNNYIDTLNKNNNVIIDDLTSKSVNNSFLYEREIINFENSISFYFENKSKQNTYKIPATNTLKHSIIEGITELIAEIDTSWEEAEQRTSYDLFMENDVILTMGYSVGVEKFLKTINKKKDGISVIVVGGDINRNGFRMAQLLSEDGVDTTYIPDSAVFAVIPKVTKVVLGSVAVSSSGGAITKIGGYNIACSAQFNSKPVTIVLPLFKLIYDPLYDPLRQNELQPGPSMIYNGAENVFVRIPKYDYIPEHLITLYITEMGPVDSFQLYNITKKKYHPDDLDLSFD
ncbi:translation initiation factor eIF-2B subunit beta, putative [Plasmodium malariae]|uniref:Translation initiation factor eIF2B subunit beta n=1 Tax=Plasmodium malariae TaxID=5858 RepID=A0A1D3TFP7_PLAMA|nr:translation initiation factor eIF-2B subunit beta, putative [Plasmodium malariae]SCP03777.1 translation initiation factor eIF-2B subunit beta, putative [Plasmodium malariae]